MAGGGGFSFGGGRARGGPVYPGQTYLVGEEGPELLQMGNRGGSVIPNDAMGGGSVQVNIINNGSSSVDVRERDTSAGKAIDVVIDEVVARKIGQRGSAANKALRTSHGTTTPLVRR
jgi:hypothetical protein